MLNNKISYYTSAKDNKGQEQTIQAAINLVNSEFLKKQTDEYRKLYAKHNPIIQKAAADLQQHENDHPDFLKQKKDTEQKIFKLKADSKKNKEKEDLNNHAIEILHKANNNIPGYNAFIETWNFYKKTKVTNQQILSDYKTSNFPAVTWAGTFTKRLADKIKQHSGCLVIDVDDLTPKEIERTINLAKHDPYILFLFVSPSGTGLKIIFLINANANEHLFFFEAISLYMHRDYALAVDPSGKDVSRLCFLCSYTNCYINDNAGVFADQLSIQQILKEQAKKKQTAKIAASKPSGNLPQLETLFDVHEFTENKIPCADGYHNKFYYLFASNACRKGFEQSETEMFMLDQYPPHDEKEIKATIKNAYNDNSNDFGKYAKRLKDETDAAQVPSNRKNAAPGKQTKLRSNANVQANTGETDRGAKDAETSGTNAAGVEDGNKKTFPQKNNGKQNNAAAIDVADFWSFKTTINKKGEIENRFDIDYNLLKEFLAAHGFYRLLMKDETYQFIKITNNRVKPVTPLQIRDFIFQYVENIKENAVAHALTRGGKQYLATDKFERLPYVSVDIKQHTERSAYFYYQNGMVEVTADEIHLHDYTTLKDTLIWERSINKRSVSIIPGEMNNVFTALHDKSEVYKFVYLASFNKNNVAATENEGLQKAADEHTRKFASICTAIGYLLHQHKTPSKAKAIIAIDHQIPADRTEQNGGTGKSIIGNYILKNMLNVAYIPGKDYNEMNAWRWEPITIDSQVVFFNDVKYNFNFEGIFELITDDMLINRRNIGYLTIPFDQSPKIYISTNFIPKGDGTSFKRRTHVIEFDNYFNEQHTPYDEFQHNLFADWRGEFADQWNYYDNFIFRCVQMYLQEGLLPYPNGNYEQRKLIAECPQEFIDWMDYYLFDAHNAISNEPIPQASKRANTDRWIEKKEMLKLWNEEAKSLSLTNLTSAHAFTKMVKKYSSTKKIALTAKKTGGKEYYCFGTPPTLSPTTSQQNIF